MDENPAHSDEWEIDNLPNRLTFFRIVMIPIIIGCLFLNLAPYSWLDSYRSDLGWIAGWTFVAASITDFFDGWVARRRNIVTVFGSFLDPIADKFLVVSSLILLQALGRIPVLIVIILVLREFYITSLRLLAGERGMKVPVSNLGKWKTGLQMVGIPNLMAAGHPWGIPMESAGLLCIYGASIISVYSALEYSLALWRKFKQARMEKKQQKLEKKNTDKNDKVKTEETSSEQND